MGVKGPAGQSREPMFPMRTVVLGTFTPSLLFGIAIGVIIPLLPLSAVRLGGDLAVAGLVASLMPLGKVLTDIPAGALAARFGDQLAMLVAALVGVVAFGAMALAPHLFVLGAGALVLGASTAVFNLARHAYLTEITPPDRRARVLSTLGGMHRIGYFIGPFLGAAVVFGTSIRPAYWLAAGCSGLAAVVLVAVREPARRAPADGPAPERSSIPQLLVRYRRLFLTLGVTTFLVGSVRGARQTVLPLWGEHLGLDPEVISIIFGLSGALDMLLFYPAGKVMDSFGRLWIGIPSMLLMALAMAVLPLAGSVPALAVVAAVLGVGNGIGSGIIMTIGADVAPPGERSAFLGVWRLFQDCGDAAGPMVISAGAALGSLAGGIWVTSALGGAAAAALGRWVPRYSEHANRTTRRRAGIPVG
ncbi:MFS transporter [Ornithinicoccus hortensis]|uniref:Putative MFS family arabinose efflux permease n=1 Tax=Ornithinicoccus hortensis TaxID=82346 RepID=A0A542YRC8_9MICO|nr:MFS transporter [Ornithinicoccus hortensis]TQL50484.1 putative MFS family arabinose efflux permease [Ornithinicoccus hortensis]